MASPYTREAQVVGELPTAEDRLKALEGAAAPLATKIGIKAVKKIGYGTPVHLAFGMTRPQAKHHLLAKLLLTNGCDLPLDLLPAFTD